MLCSSRRLCLPAAVLRAVAALLLAKAFEQLEAAAEEVGTPLPDDVWQRAWEQLSRELGRRLPPLPGMESALEADSTADGDGDPDLTPEDLRVLRKLMRARRRPRAGSA